MKPAAPAAGVEADPFTAVVVQKDPEDVRFALSALEAHGFRVSVADGFAQAKGLIDRQVPDVLVTDVRLHDYNGLHLVLRGKGIRPSMAAVVVTTIADPVIQVEAERTGATFVLRPTSEQQFLAAVFRTLFRPVADSRPIRPLFERRAGERRHALRVVGQSERRVEERRRQPWPYMISRITGPAQSSSTSER